jgi:galactonate dehydratase
MSDSADLAPRNRSSRRRFIAASLAGAGASAVVFAMRGIGQERRTNQRQPYAADPPLIEDSRVLSMKHHREKMRVTKLETLFVQPRWLFLKIHTDAGIVGWGEPIVEGRAKTVATAIEELAEYLIGKDPRDITHHWQAMYRHAFYRGGPVLTSAISGIDMALWDIKGKALGVPVYELLGGPNRRFEFHSIWFRCIQAVYSSGCGSFCRASRRRWG